MQCAGCTSSPQQTGLGGKRAAHSAPESTDQGVTKRPRTEEGPAGPCQHNEGLTNLSTPSGTSTQHTAAAGDQPSDCLPCCDVFNNTAARAQQSGPCPTKGALDGAAQGDTTAAAATLTASGDGLGGYLPQDLLQQQPPWAKDPAAVAAAAAKWLALQQAAARQGVGHAAAGTAQAGAAGAADCGQGSHERFPAAPAADPSLPQQQPVQQQPYQQVCQQQQQQQQQQLCQQPQQRQQHFAWSLPCMLVCGAPTPTGVAVIGSPTGVASLQPIRPPFMQTPPLGTAAAAAAPGGERSGLLPGLTGKWVFPQAGPGPVLAAAAQQPPALLQQQQQLAGTTGWGCPLRPPLQPVPPAPAAAAAAAAAATAATAAAAAAAAAAADAGLSIQQACDRLPSVLRSTVKQYFSAWASSLYPGTPPSVLLWLPVVLLLQPLTLQQQLALLAGAGPAAAATGLLCIRAVLELPAVQAALGRQRRWDVLTSLLQSDAYALAQQAGPDFILSLLGAPGKPPAAVSTSQQASPGAAAGAVLGSAAAAGCGGAEEQQQCLANTGAHNQQQQQQQSTYGAAAAAQDAWQTCPSVTDILGLLPCYLPAATAVEDAQQLVAWLLRTYGPLARPANIKVTALLARMQQQAQSQAVSVQQLTSSSRPCFCGSSSAVSTTAAAAAAAAAGEQPPCRCCEALCHVWQLPEVQRVVRQQRLVQQEGAGLWQQQQQQQQQPPAAGVQHQAAYLPPKAAGQTTKVAAAAAAAAAADASQQKAAAESDRWQAGSSSSLRFESEGSEDSDSDVSVSLDSEYDTCAAAQRADTAASGAAAGHSAGTTAAAGPCAASGSPLQHPAAAADAGMPSLTITELQELLAHETAAASTAAADTAAHPQKLPLHSRREGGNSTAAAVVAPLRDMARLQQGCHRGTGERQVRELLTELDVLLLLGRYERGFQLRSSGRVPLQPAAAALNVRHLLQLLEMPEVQAQLGKQQQQQVQQQQQQDVQQRLHETLQAAAVRFEAAAQQQALLTECPFTASRLRSAAAPAGEAVTSCGHMAGNHTSYPQPPLTAVSPQAAATGAAAAADTGLLLARSPPEPYPAAAAAAALQPAGAAPSMSVLWGSLMQRGWLLQEVSDSMTALQQLARLLHLKAEGGNADLARVRRLLRRWGVLYDSLRQQLQVQGGGSGQGCGGIRAETAVQRLQALQKLMGVPEVLAQFGSSEEVGGITQGIAAAVAEFEGMLHCQHHAAVPAVGPVSASERQHQWAAVLEGGFVQAGVAAAAGDSGGGGGDDAERQAVLALASLAGLK